MTTDPLRRLHLVTHAEAQHHVDGLVGGWYDSELTARGRDQAERIAAVLADRIGSGAVRIHSSDLKRARQTAEPLARRLGTAVALDPRLRERCFGEAEGKSQEWLRARTVPLPGGADLLSHDDGPAGTETRRQLAERVRAALAAILTDPHEHEVVVSHGSATSHLISAWLRIPIDAAGRGFFPLSAGSITTLGPSPTHGSHNLLTLNETVHLDGR